jgi:hypothetical protein
MRSPNGRLLRSGASAFLLPWAYVMSGNLVRELEGRDGGMNDVVFLSSGSVIVIDERLTLVTG